MAGVAWTAKKGRACQPVRVGEEGDDMDERARSLEGRMGYQRFRSKTAL